MKKLFLIALVAMLGFSSCKYDDSDLWSKVNEYGESIKDHENRIAALEEACKQINTNVKALQVLVNAIDVGDYITNITPVMKDGEEIGYAISFSESNPITIYHGQDGENGIDGVDGKDGQDGKDGKNGYTPKIGVKKYTDGIYYWTLDGTWLLDSNNQRIKAVGIDGKDGVDGTDGKNGANGKDGVDGTDGKDGVNGIDGTDGSDGKDGITPRLKIEYDFWYVSYNDGATWIQLGKATGEDGKDGSNGADGDGVFKSVTQDDEYVYFNMADGSMITLPKHDKENIQFEDLQVKAICCANWDTNNDGELSYAEAAAVKTIGSVFEGNTSIIAFAELKYFTGITEIPYEAFYGCTALWKVVLPKNVITLSTRAFRGCKNLVNIEFPQNLTSILLSAFEECSSLRNVFIPDKVVTISDGAFGKCSSIQTINTTNNLSNVPVPESSNQGAFQHSTGKIYINGNIQDGFDYNNNIYRCGLFMNAHFSEVVISENVTHLGRYAFLDNKKLEKVYVKSMTPPTIGYYAFDYEYNGYCYPLPNLVIYVPTGAVDAYKTKWARYADKIEGYNFEE